MTQRSQQQAGLQTKLIQDMLSTLGTPIDSASLILDFGCGEGELVYQLRKKGLQAFGVDIENRYGDIRQRCIEEGISKAREDIFRTIDVANFKIPFDDNTFDCIVSFYVFEHAQNWSQSLAEIKRVLKPGGASLHIFPSRYCPIELHTFVPWAGIIQTYAYLAFWAISGIRNSYQKNLSWQEVAKINFEYLRTCTTYLTGSEIRKQVVSHFGNVSFVEGVFIEHHSGRLSRYLSFIARKFPFVPACYSTFYTRVIYFKKQATHLQATTF